METWKEFAENVIYEKTGMIVEEVKPALFKSKYNLYVYDKQFTKDIREKLGNFRVYKDKAGFFFFHIINGITVEEAKVIRRALRKLSNDAGAYPLSVRKDTGTASGWITIRPMNQRRLFNPMEGFILKELGLDGGSSVELISPSETKEVTARAIKILGEDQP